MRHFLSSLAIIALTAFLLLIALGFAWVRSSQIALTTESALRDAEAGVVNGVLMEGSPGKFEWEKLGVGAYVRNCQSCHGSEGKGWDQYPGLEQSGRLALAPGGREYLVDVHLYGLASERWRAPMPPMGTMSDAELAAVLNYVVTRFGTDAPVEEDFRPYVPIEISARRGQKLRPADVNTARP